MRSSHTETVEHRQDMRADALASAEAPPPAPVPVRDSGTATVSLTALAPFIRLLEELGPELTQKSVDRALAILQNWGIVKHDREFDPTLRIPHDLTTELFELFLDCTQDPSAALRAGFKLQRGDYELLEYLCGSCNTLADAIACLTRYYPLLIGAELELVLDDERERAEHRFSIAKGLATSNELYEFALSSNYAMTILHIDLNNAIPPIEVNFAHPAPSYHELFPQMFGVPVYFDRPYNSIVFHTSMLKQPFHGADPVLHAVLKRLADQELSQLETHSAFPNMVREIIESELVNGAALDSVAERMHMSPGGLRSRLRQHGATYSGLLDEVRKDHAKRALRDTQLSIAELAHRLGFSHAPAFHRAFRRWFGVTPNVYREVKSEHPSARFWRRQT
ncbi:MAG: hypothetical protein RL701_5973 [Pseudomonadota bacterium]|jgi:AraC-like DNA-binding protein